MTLFVRITIALVGLFVALAVVAFLIKAVVAAATLAIIALGALFALNFVRAFARRRQAEGVLPGSRNVTPRE